MIVHYSSDRGLTQQEVEDLRRFKILLSCLTEQRPPVPELIFPTPTTLSSESMSSLPGAPTDSVWRAEYDRMISTAAKFGWIDESSDLIRAHVERTSP